MSKYVSVEEISNEIGVSDKTVYKRCAMLGIDTAKITAKAKKEIIDACSETISRKAESKELEEKLKGIKVSPKYRLFGTNGSKVQMMLDLALQDFDANQKMILECQEVIDQFGTIMKTSHNGTISSNPAVKTKTELLKAQSTLRKDIKELENALNTFVIDDDSPFGDE